MFLVKLYLLKTSKKRKKKQTENKTKQKNLLQQQIIEYASEYWCYFPSAVTLIP